MYRYFIKTLTQDAAISILEDWGDMADEYYPQIVVIYKQLVKARGSGNNDLWQVALDAANNLLNETWGKIGTSADYNDVCEAVALLGGYSDSYNLPREFTAYLSSAIDWKNQLKDLLDLRENVGDNPSEVKDELEGLQTNLLQMQYTSAEIYEFIDATLEGGNMYG